jgi:hypothetical protein
MYSLVQAAVRRVSVGVLARAYFPRAQFGIFGNCSRSGQGLLGISAGLHCTLFGYSTPWSLQPMCVLDIWFDLFVARVFRVRHPLCAPAAVACILFLVRDLPCRKAPLWSVESNASYA